MNTDDKEFMEKYILNNPFDFKQCIISHCREMDKIDVYNWVVEDELKINKLQQENKQLKGNWNKLKEYFNERIEVCDNRLSSPFCNFEKATKERLIFSQCLEKLEELEGSDSNE